MTFVGHFIGRCPVHKRDRFLLHINQRLIFRRLTTRRCLSLTVVEFGTHKVKCLSATGRHILAAQNLQCSM